MFQNVPSSFKFICTIPVVEIVQTLDSNTICSFRGLQPDVTDEMAEADEAERMAEAMAAGKERRFVALFGHVALASNFMTTQRHF